MAKAPASLGLAKIGAPGQPKKVSLSLDPTLATELDNYAAAYEGHYGEKVDVETLIPHILHSFIASDRGFKKWKTEAARKPADAS